MRDVVVLPRGGCAVVVEDLVSEVDMNFRGKERNLSGRPADLGMKEVILLNMLLACLVFSLIPSVCWSMCWICSVWLCSNSPVEDAVTRASHA